MDLPFKETKTAGVESKTGFTSIDDKQLAHEHEVSPFVMSDPCYYCEVCRQELDANQIAAAQRKWIQVHGTR